MATPKKFLNQIFEISQNYFYILATLEIFLKAFLHFFGHAHKKFLNQIFAISQKVFLHIFWPRPRIFL